MKKFDHVQVESDARSYWRATKVYDRIKERNLYNQPFAFLDGPPYTSGKVHLGTAWNKTLKDTVLRVKRMQGFNVYDRAGYDMHGLPTEHATMKKLGLHTNEDILKYGMDKFIDACREWCVTNMHEMNKEFEKLGVWMDFENAYQTIAPSYIEGIWMLMKRAYEHGRLYEGLRTMAWDPVFQTACAKHELDYQTVTDQSIYVKFRVLQHGKPTDEYLVIWTTTPWTIPFNMAIMVNPSETYVKAKVGKQTWIVAEALAEKFIKEIAGEDYAVTSTLLGKELKGVQYEHPFGDVMQYAELKSKHPNVHSVVLSSEYVDTSSGTGLVHCAPGCGPEDYEVGVENHLPAYNTIAGDATFPAPFAGLRARIDDKEFIALLDERGVIAAKQRITHEYPHSERSKAPVVYKTTKQWFFKVTDLKERMVAANDHVQWQPQAGFNAFKSWLENLRDNSITKQRYWGTPVPIWKNDHTGEVLVIGSIEELERLSGKTLSGVMDVHKPSIDHITIPSKKHPGTVLKRIPDVLDVWVDAGSASWNALNYPGNTELIKTHLPAHFILEGKDQIRGWFNLLMVAGFLAFDKPSFERVYMHGYINDSQGRKMSKSLGNYITPDEVLPKYGVDAFRLYVIGGTAPGLDLNYNIEDLSTTYKNINVLWNTVQYLVDLCKNNELTPERSTSGDEEERYLLSRMESMTLAVHEALETYDLSAAPHYIEEFWLEVSRTYIQLIREKASGEEKQLVANTLYTVLERTLTLLAPFCPFTAEILWQDLSELTSAQGSVHEQLWPHVNKKLIDKRIEEHFGVVQNIITASLSCREQLKQGVRWPLAELVISTQRPFKEYDELIKRQVNVKKITWGQVHGDIQVVPNYGALGKSFGKDTQRVAKLIEGQDQKPPYMVEGFHILPEHVVIKESAPQGYATSTYSEGTVYLQSAVTPELIEEGFIRELTRRVQALRKDMGLQKKDVIGLHVSSMHSISAHHLDELMRKCNAMFEEKHFSNKRDEHIKDRTYTISAQKTI
jgi:isoleucyl-tRNA synthetase